MSTTQIHFLPSTVGQAAFVQSEGEALQMSWEQYVNDLLWQILVDAVHTIVMFPHHKAYVRDVVLAGHPQITPEDLALKLDISLGESLIILYELQKSKSENLKQLNDLNR